MVAIFRVLPALLALAGGALATNPVIVQGQQFVDTVTKNRIMIVGVDYQPGGQAAFNPNVRADALSNGTVCLRDAALLQKLGVNTIRVYNVDPAANHDLCASIFNTAGIYMIIDVNSPQQSIDRSNPSSSYTTSYLTRIFGVVEAFKAYPNTMAFFAANEVMNDVGTGVANPPYIRAVQRDLRQYIAKHSSRPIPVGYSAADVREILHDTWAYLQCSNTNSTNGVDDSRSEFFGLNSYSWCGDASYQTAGYDTLVSFFQNSSIPVFYSEYGCNKVQPRIFSEVGSLYGTQMTSLSGGLVYEYSQETSDYGLVTINEDGSIKLRTDFDNLQKQYNKLDLKLLTTQVPSSVSIQPPTCSSNLVSDSGFTKNFQVPDQPNGASALIASGIQSPNNGKLIAVGDLNVKIPIFGSNGNAITGLAVKALDKANTPSGESTTGGTSTSSGATPSTTKKSSAGKNIALDSALACWAFVYFVKTLLV